MLSQLIRESKVKTEGNVPSTKEVIKHIKKHLKVKERDINLIKNLEMWHKKGSVAVFTIKGVKYTMYPERKGKKWTFPKPEIDDSNPNPIVGDPDEYGDGYERWLD